jgi:hypothetical protein
MRRVRTLVIWLLTLALPFQGYAAASMLACMVEATPVVEADSLTPMSAAPRHAGEAGKQAAVASEAADAPSGDHSSTGCSCCKLCKLCAACHGVAVITTALLPAVSVLPQADLIEPDVASVTAPSRPLERPPRA